MKRRGLGIALFALLALAGFSAIVMLLWNMLFPEIFGLSVISYWQAAGLLILARILFGGIGGRKRFAGRFHSAMHGPGGRNPIHDKWMKMTPGQRAEFIRRRKEFMCGERFGRAGFFSRDDFGFNAGNNSKEDNE